MPACSVRPLPSPGTTGGNASITRRATACILARCCAACGVTMWVARARRDGALATTITSIDPNPRAGIDELCDRVLRSPLELADLSVFEELTAGDIVLCDGSHRIFMNSDVAAFQLDVLPSLA